MYKNLQEFIYLLENEGELIRIKEYTDPILEITEITDRISKTQKGGKALLFENTGTGFPVLTNAFGSDKRMALALGRKNLQALTQELTDFFLQITSPKNTLTEKLSALGQLKQLSGIIPKHIKKGECQEIVHYNPDLNILPVLQCWPDDGGKFITLPIVHTKDPKTGIRNVGMYRMQIFGKDITGMHWHKHKVGARHYAEYKELDKKIPVAVALGGDPVYTYCATAPLPDNVDEYMLAGYLRKKPVKLVKCLTQDIEVPADVDIVIEGYIDPAEELIYEGPFGDHTGFYSLPDYYPKFHVTCITHRKNAIYPATIVGVPPQEDAYIAKATERLFLPLLQKSIASEVVDFHLPEAGVAHNFTIVKIKPQYEGHAQKIMSSFWGNGQMALNKCLFVVDDKDIDLEDYEKFAQKALKNFDPETDLVYSQGPIDVLDHAAEKFTFGSKIGLDFTTKFKDLKQENSNYISDFQLDISTFDDITAYNSLLDRKIPILIIAIKKRQKIEGFSEKFIKKFDELPFKIIIFVDNWVNIRDLYLVAWIAGNNIAPKRDTFVVKDSKGNGILIVDATEKTKEIDDFEREWPPITVMNDEIIKKIDKKWEKLNLGNFVKSPSLQFKK